MTLSREHPDDRYGSPATERTAMKKIEVRKTGDVRLTSAANPLYGVLAASTHSSISIVVCG
jgi:hypothetical protein